MYPHLPLSPLHYINWRIILIKYYHSYYLNIREYSLILARFVVNCEIDSSQVLKYGASKKKRPRNGEATNAEEEVYPYMLLLNIISLIVTDSIQ